MPAKKKKEPKKDVKKDSKLKPAVLFSRTMKISRVEEKKIKREEGDDTYVEKATFTDGSGDKATLSMGSLPSGVVKGVEVEIRLVTSQSKLEDHN